MIHSLFSIPVYHDNLYDHDLFLKIKEVLYKEFEKTNEDLSSLEKQGGCSTYLTNNKLHLLPYINELSSRILNHCKIYWKILDIDQRLYPVIDECWSNIHYKNSFTGYHSHSLHPLVVTIYLEAEQNCGNLILINPMEYGITHIPYGVPIEKKLQTEIAVRTGDIVIFPGWIRHMTGENKSNSNRIVISFNLRYGGTYLNSNVEYHNTIESTNSEINFLQNKIANLEFALQNIQRTIAK